MAWAIFHRTVHMNGSQRVPKSRVGFSAQPSPEPQQFPHDFIEYAVSVGAATEIPPPGADGKRTKRRSKRA